MKTKTLIFLNFTLILKITKDAYIFEDRNNLLKLKAGSLPYVPNRKYEIFLSTIYYNITYYQYTIINIEPPPQLPISIIG
jgi:hypothetical protein